MNKKRFLQLWVPPACIVLAIVIALTATMVWYGNMMDLIFGRGKRIVTKVEGDLEADYYETAFNSAAEAAEYGKALTEKIADEGIVLLKNNEILPLAEGAFVTPFGYHYLHPNYGPSSGSAVLQDKTVITATDALKAMYSVNENAERVMKSAVPQGLTKDRYFDVTDGANNQVDVIEFRPEIYHGIETSCQNSTGIIFVGRSGGEGADSDITSEALFDGTPHGLALSQYERETIRFAKTYCDRVIVVLNSCNPMELSCLIEGELEVDAILWMGGAGSAGFCALTDIIAGKVNPSGRLPDIYVKDNLKNPVMANYGGGYAYQNVEQDLVYQISANFVEYEEGIYNGYRYYETAAEVGFIDFEEEVVFPFGYGLSYTKFEKSITSFSADEKKISVTVKVKNVGTLAGKEVVQIYFAPPYTEETSALEVEKSAATLAGFEKTELLSANKETEIEITFAIEDMASWCSGRENGDGTTGCYMLEKGEYIISLRNNSHEVLEIRSYTVPETIFFDNSNPRQADKIAATDRFANLTDYMSAHTTTLSRSDWAGTQPTSSTNFTAPDEVLAEINNTRFFNAETDENLGNCEGSKVFKSETLSEKQKNGATLADMRGLSYDDPYWDTLLDQLDYSAADLWDMLSMGYMHTGSVDRVGLPNVQMRDGPLGITASMSDNSLETFAHNSYCAMPVLAATFNRSLACELGEALAQEAFWHGDGRLVSGVYAPALNVHRGAFGGRFYEYMSEDPLLIGELGAKIISGGAKYGLIMLMKHFVANNQDAVRDGLNTWMTEQTLREIYLKPYEICIKTATVEIKYYEGDKLTINTMRAALGLMTSKNSLGATFCSANYALLTEVLRNEWDFKGFVISDILNFRAGELYSKMYRSGLNIVMAAFPQERATGMDSTTGKHIVRESVHHLCFAVVNSSAMQGVPPGAVIRYGLSPWLALMIALNVIVVLVILVMGVVTWRKFRKNSDKNKRDLN